MKINNGDCFDKNGVPIYEGDLLEIWHFKGCGRRNHFLYHVVVMNHEYRTLEMIPVTELVKPNGGRCLLTMEIASGAKVISGSKGYAPDCVCYHSRKRKREK